MERLVESIILERDKVMKCIREDSGLAGSSKVTSSSLDKRGSYEKKTWLECI